MDGIYTTRQLNELGLGSTQINRKLGTSLHRLDRGLYSNRELGVLERARALQRHNPKLIFDGPTAYDLYRKRIPELPLIATAGATRSSEHFRTNRSRRRSYRLIDGLRLVSPLRAVVGVPESHGLLAYFLSDMYPGWRGKEEFARDRAELTPEEARGLEPIIRRATIGASSRWERQVIAQLEKIGLAPVPNYRLGPYHWDIGFRYGSVVMDLDSDRYHGSGVNTRTFIVDRWKTNHAVRAGWAPLRYTNHCTDSAMKWMLREITNTLESRRRNPSTRYGRDLPDSGVWAFHMWISG